MADQLIFKTKYKDCVIVYFMACLGVQRQSLTGKQ